MTIRIESEKIKIGDFELYPCNGNLIFTGFVSASSYCTAGSGQQLYDTPGAYTFIAPSGVTSVSVVTVGGGGAGNSGWSSPAGNGGSLGWKNAIPVTSGNSYTVCVGAGGATVAAAGGESYFVSNTCVAGKGGAAAGTAQPSPSYVGDCGGTGGAAGNWNGGGGAGGYTGNGGTPGAAGSGGGGGGGYWYSTTFGTGAGGGVGLCGQGANGAAGDVNDTVSRGGGFGGSGGCNGGPGQNPFDNGFPLGRYCGGAFGGGGGGPGTSMAGYTPCGGKGGVRIIWGGGRAFPSTNTTDVT